MTIYSKRIPHITSMELDTYRDNVLRAIGEYTGALRAYATRPDLAPCEVDDIEDCIKHMSKVLDKFIKVGH